MTEQRQTIDLRHAHITDQNVEGTFVGARHRLLAVRHGFYTVASALERLPHGHANERIIFSDQYIELHRYSPVLRHSIALRLATVLLTSCYQPEFRLSFVLTSPETAPPMGDTAKRGKQPSAELT